MIRFLNKMKRFFSLFGLGLFLLVGSALLMEQELNTGFFFLFSFFLVLFYGPITWLLKKLGYLDFTPNWFKKEKWRGLLMVGLLMKIGLLEALFIQPEYIVIFALLLTFTLIACLLQLRNDQIQQQGFSTIDKKKLTKIAFWCFVFGGGFSLIFAENFNDEDLVAISAVVYFPTLFFLTIRWLFNQIRSIINLKNEQAKTELLHLKSQVNPHFFFNMLNNLYGLAEKDTKKTRSLILKLSDMMRYSIYDGQKEEVTLEEEMDYLKNYIELHKMRYHKTIDIEFNTAIETEGIQIMPLLFIILLENAFKHGVENLTEKAYVHVDIQADEYAVHFRVENNFDATRKNGKKGIGLDNLKRRLELVYEKKHELNFTQQEDVFVAELSLFLQAKKRRRLGFLPLKPVRQESFLVPEN